MSKTKIDLFEVITMILISNTIVAILLNSYYKKKELLEHPYSYSASPFQNDTNRWMIVKTDGTTLQARTIDASDHQIFKTNYVIEEITETNWVTVMKDNKEFLDLSHTMYVMGFDEGVWKTSDYFVQLNVTPERIEKGWYLIGVTNLENVHWDMQEKSWLQFSNQNFSGRNRSIKIN